MLMPTSMPGWAFLNAWSARRWGSIRSGSVTANTSLPATMYGPGARCRSSLASSQERAGRRGGHFGQVQQDHDGLVVTAAGIGLRVTARGGGQLTGQVDAVHPAAAVDAGRCQLRRIPGPGPELDRGVGHPGFGGERVMHVVVRQDPAIGLAVHPGGTQMPGLCCQSLSGDER